MKLLLRALLPLPSLALAALSGAAVTLSFGTHGGAPLTTLLLPAGGSAVVSVYYTSTYALSDGSLFLAYDRALHQGELYLGTPVAPTEGLVSLSLPSDVASGVNLTGPRLAGAFGPDGDDRPYGLDVPGVDGSLPATATPRRLFDVTVRNLALAPGQGRAVSFLVAGTPLYTTELYGPGADYTVVGTPLLVQAVPEPAPLAALGLGILAVLRRRKRA